ncbi:zinc-ribbon domain-containing protein [Parolsenella catena]|uniref:zinc-ribbon domain-containing protein n=1 Tax=Parolsenella catena TaxID=2003188 RepID=UPI003F9D2ED1
MFCTNCGKELKPGAKFCTTCGYPVDAGDAGETKVVSSPDETSVVSPDATTVSGPAAETTVIPESPAAPEHDREADTAAAVASFDDVEPASAPAYAAPAPVPPAPAGEAPKKKGHGALVIGIVALIAVLAVGGALYVRLHGLPGSAQTAYTADAPAQVSAKTRVRPKDANGKEMSAYVAYLVSTKGTGDAASISTTPYRYEGTDDSGFTLEDFGDVEDGDYTLVIVDNSDSGSSVRYDVPVHYEHDNPKAPESLDPEPPAPSADDAQAAATTTDARTDEQKAADLYLAKCREYIDKYGKATLTHYDYVDLASGLAVARLMDFDGDGTDELLLAYDTVPAPSGSSFDYDSDQKSAYKVEVWAYKDGKISKVYDEPDTVLSADDGSLFVQICTLDGTETCVSTRTQDYDENTFSDVFRNYAFDGDEFDVALETASSSERGGSNTVFTVDGQEVSLDDELAASKRVQQSDCFWLLASTYFQNSPDVSQTVSDTNATLDELKSRSEGNAATTAAATSEQAYTSESVDKSYTIVNPYSPSSTQGVMWSYPQFSKVDGSTDAALDALNAQLAKACEDDANLGKAWGPASDAMMVDDHQDLCASINGSIASVFSARDETGGGAHGTDESFGTFYDLSTGKAVDATTALNMSAEDLQAKGAAGINAFLAKNPSDLGVSADDISKMAGEQDRYVRDEKGTFIITRSYELGSYAFGSHRIYVMANDPANNAIVGTEVADNY